MTTIVTGALAPGRSIDGDSFTDIVGGWVTVEMDGGLVVASFDCALTESQVVACYRRITMTPVVEAAFIELEQRVAALEPTTEGPA